MRTVDLVIAGDGSEARTAAAAALLGGRRVLIAVRAGAAAARRLRKYLRRVAPTGTRRLIVVTHADVVCVDGVDGVEAVVLRHAPTGRLLAVNAAAFLSSVRQCGERRDGGEAHCERPAEGDTAD